MLIFKINDEQFPIIVTDDGELVLKECEKGTNNVRVLQHEIDTHPPEGRPATYNFDPRTLPFLAWVCYDMTNGVGGLYENGKRLEPWTFEELDLAAE